MLRFEASSAHPPSNGRRPSQRRLVWLLFDNRVGDNNQLLALADALGFPFAIKQMRYNVLRRIPLLNRESRLVVAGEARSLIRPPWPDLVIVTGYGGVAVARYIRTQSGGHTKLVHVGNPRACIDDFDLQITTPQYARSARNLIELPFPIGNPAKTVEPTRDEVDWLGKFQRPRRLVAVGGPARHWQLNDAAVVDAIEVLRQKSPKGSIIVATSARTTNRTRRLLQRVVVGEQEVMVEDGLRFGVLLSRCDEFHVTADSVSMLSEAILSGKPVGMIPIERSLRGRMSHWLWERPLGRVTLPDLANFWKLLNSYRLVGTVELPVASQVCDTVDRAADAVRDLLTGGEAVDDGRAQHAASYLGDPGREGRRQRPGDRARTSAEAPV